MKVLSVKQPFAYLLCANLKNIENRSWKLPEKYKGETILIHASARPNISILGSSTIFSKEQWDYLKGFDMMLPFFQDKLPTSAIIGSVRFVDCVINHPSIWAEKTERFAINESWPNGRPESAGKKGDIYNWVATDAVLFEEPILNVKGKLGFWDYPMTENEYNNLAKIGV